MKKTCNPPSRFLSARVFLCLCWISALVLLQSSVSTAEGVPVPAFEGGEAHYRWFVDLSSNQSISSIEWKYVDEAQPEKRLMLLRNGVLQINPNFIGRYSWSQTNSSDVGMVQSNVDQSDAPDKRLYSVVVTVTDGQNNYIRQKTAKLSVLKTVDGLETVSSNCRYKVGDLPEQNILKTGYPLQAAPEGTSLTFSVKCDLAKVPTVNITLTAFGEKNEQNSAEVCQRASSCSLSVSNPEGETPIKQLKFQMDFGVELDLPENFGQIELSGPITNIALIIGIVILVIYLGCILVFVIFVACLLPDVGLRDGKVIALIVISVLIPLIWPVTFWVIYHRKKGVHVPLWYWILWGISIPIIILWIILTAWLLYFKILKPNRSKVEKSPRSSAAPPTPPDGVKSEHPEEKYLMDNKGPVNV